jgi:hypothetical protein
MTSRHEKPIYEGQSRRVAERRKGDRRKSVTLIKLFQYLAVIVTTVVIVKYLKL